jgi:hypothetical protein
MAASKQIDLTFNALSRAIVTTVKPSWLIVFCGEEGHLIGQCVNKRAARQKEAICWCTESGSNHGTLARKATVDVGR